jgi:iron complex outermembrane receptor protein
VDFAPDKNLWGGKIALEYALAEVSMLYASVSRGYRANGINAEIFASINASDDPAVIAQLQAVREYDEETLLNYELGLKTSLLNKRLQLRLALFYMDREDQQVKGAFLIDQDDGGTTFVDYTDNAAQGNNYGLELESDWLASDALRLWANLGLLKTEYEDYINAEGVDLSGRDQAQAPGYQYALGGRYSFTNGLYLQVDVEGKDGFYFSDRHAAQSDAYDLLNARMGYNTGRWQLAVWGRNLGDEDYYVRGFGSFGNDPRKDYVTEPYYQLGEPRRVGVSASYTF